MKSGIVKYVSVVRKMFILLSCIVLPAVMVMLVLAVSGYTMFAYLAPALLIVYFFLYGCYALRVSMGTVTGVEITKEVIHLYTKRKVFTYDAESGCVELKTYKNKFVGTFEGQGSRDKFIFYRRVLFSKYSEEQFTLAEIRNFYPAAKEYGSD